MLHRRLITYKPHSRTNRPEIGGLPRQGQAISDACGNSSIRLARDGQVLEMIGGM